MMGRQDRDQGLVSATSAHSGEPQRAFDFACLTLSDCGPHPADLTAANSGKPPTLSLLGP